MSDISVDSNAVHDAGSKLITVGQRLGEGVASARGALSDGVAGTGHVVAAEALGSFLAAAHRAHVACGTRVAAVGIAAHAAAHHYRLIDTDIASAMGETQR